MRKIIRKTFGDSEETTESDKARFGILRTFVFFLAAFFVSTWFFREHYTTEALAESDWSVQYVAGLCFAMIATGLFFYLWKLIEDEENRQDVRKILDSL